MDDKAKKLLSRFQASCAKREYCSSDIFAKAKMAMDGDEIAASEIVAELVREKYVDDLRYATAFAREKASLQGWGKMKISFMLVGKGIQKELVSKALEGIDSESADKKLEAVVSTKYRTLSDDPQCKLKLLKFALGRGYSYDEVKAVVERVISDGLEESLDGISD